MVAPHTLRRRTKQDLPPETASRLPKSDDLETVSVSWLLLQRLDDLKGAIATLERHLDAVDRRFEAIEPCGSWSLALIAALALGLLAKLLIPGP